MSRVVFDSNESFYDKDIDRVFKYIEEEGIERAFVSRTPEGFISVTVYGAGVIGLDTETRSDTTEQRRDLDIRGVD